MSEHLENVITLHGIDYVERTIEKVQYPDGTVVTLKEPYKFLDPVNRPPLKLEVYKCGPELEKLFKEIMENDQNND